MRKSCYSSRRAGFTVLEIMVVVLILGIILAVAVPHFQKATLATRQARLANDFRQLHGAFELFELENGYWPMDVATARLPAEMVGYLDAQVFADPSPLGGLFDYEGPEASLGIEAGLSLVGTNLDPGVMARVDEMFDDGDLANGRFRVGIAGGDTYTLIFEE